MVTAKKPASPPRKNPTQAALPTAADRPISADPSPQDSPVVFRGSDQNLHGALKVDSAVFAGARLQIEGWLVGSGVLGLRCAGEAVVFKIMRKARPDVATAMDLSETGEGFGFTMVAAKGVPPYELDLALQIDGKNHQLKFPLKIERSVPLGPGGKPGVLGAIEAASASSLTEDGVVLGWAILEPGASAWLETEDGQRTPFESTIRLARPDVFDSHGQTFGESARLSGFLARLTGVLPGSVLRLMGEKNAGPELVGQFEFDMLPMEPAPASRWLFGIASPASELVQRYEALDTLVLDALIRQGQRKWAELPVESRQLGPANPKPLASVIVPLFGRIDFVEHQLMEFSRDPSFLQDAELIYVLDDPTLVDKFSGLVQTLHRLYDVPFRWVWGHANRGFSGANNLGAAQASAAHLVFLNSDAIPQQPGWLQPLLDVLRNHPRVGAVGPRLTFADGSIQHAGMAFVRREDLGVWVNDHPQMGLDPCLDPFVAATKVPAVTGACLAMRRKDFDKVGGWDTGYLIGDFEDSDLCLKLRNTGLDIVYLPTVQLTHLERQSFKDLGSGDYRTRVVIYNALRHQRKWERLISLPFKSSAL